MIKPIKHFFLSLFILVPVLTFGATSDEIVKERQENFQSIKENVKSLGGAISDQDQAKAGKIIDALIASADKVVSLFSEESRNPSVDTDALDDIWSNFADFKKKSENMKKVFVQIKSEIKADDFIAADESAGKIKATCKSCHQDYRD